MTLGLVGQLALDELVRKAADKKAKDDAKKGGATIQPVDAPTEAAEPEFVPEAARAPRRRADGRIGLRQEGLIPPFHGD